MYISKYVLDETLGNLSTKDLENTEVIEKAARDIIDKSALSNPFMFNQTLTEEATKLGAALLRSDYNNESCLNKFNSHEEIVRHLEDITVHSLQTTICSYLTAKRGESNEY
jgi:hypothetical protein